MTIDQFVKFAKDCKSKPELSSLAKANGIPLSKSELDEIFNKISSGGEISDENMLNVSGGTEVYGQKSFILKEESRSPLTPSEPRGEERI